MKKVMSFNLSKCRKDLLKVVNPDFIYPKGSRPVVLVALEPFFSDSDNPTFNYSVYSLSSLNIIFNSPERDNFLSCVRFSILSVVL